MQKALDHLVKLIFVLVACAGWMQPAAAAMITVSGTLFDVRYDDAQLDPLNIGQYSLFGAPTISGSNIIFQPNNMFAQSTPGSQTTPDAHKTFTFNMDIVPKAGSQLQVSALSLAELGDFTLTGAGSNVHVGGQLIAYDLANPFFSYTSSNIAMVAPGNTANTVSALPNVQNGNWVAQAALNSSTQPLPFANPAGIHVVLQNQLDAFVQTNDPNNLAFIQKKLTGDAVTLTVVSQVPVPAAIWFFASGFLGLAGVARRRGRTAA